MFIIFFKFFIIDYELKYEYTNLSMQGWFHPDSYIRTYS